MRDYFQKYLNKFQPAATNSSRSVTKKEDVCDTLNGRIENKTKSPNNRSRHSVDIVIENGTLVVPGVGIQNTDLWIQDRKIAGIGKSHNIDATRRIDATGMLVLPGIVDPHVHFGITASFEDDIYSESKSAIIGGITTVGCFFGGNDSYFDSISSIDASINEYSFVDVFPHFVIQNDNQLKELPDYHHFLKVRSFKVYLTGIDGLIPSMDDGFVMKVYTKLKELNSDAVLCCHAENSGIVNSATESLRNEKGEQATIRDWDITHPPIAEAEAIQRMGLYSQYFKVPTYLVHISSKLGIEMGEKVKRNNPWLFLETTSPYLTLSNENFNSNLHKMVPPIRTNKDKDALKKALMRGTIDTIGTDNVCLTKDLKQMGGSILDAFPGYSVLETHLPSVLNSIDLTSDIELLQAVTAMTQNPARIFGLYPQKGSLLPGSDADIIIVDPKKKRKIISSQMQSRSDFSIYEDKTLVGWPVVTIKGGEVVMEDSILTNERARAKRLM